MNTLAFDTLQYARRLKAAGCPEQQAEVQAELMAEAFGFYATNIVTKDYLDETLRARLNELDAKWEQRFGEWDAKWERCFGEWDAKWERRFGEVDTKWEQRSGSIELHWSERHGELRATLKLHTVMLGGTWLLLGYPLLLDLVQALRG